ncbi:uncharacterized protein N7484_011264 [Penicillium longicatenatum]|uniref:uncharacterized protein n=1 Tax=Penicillium longicatenatum TaxID=1561947 RepID=UPI002547F6FC|nr:uncharacterized protein N7484_011264 [Penicillium longicatenatum]KAJ5631164.1 hypothetical protein N7484_011264 [Penicillium longicatenatum]
MFKFATTAFLLASCLPATLADTCYAVGWQHQTTVKGSTQADMGVYLYKGDEKIGEAESCSKCPHACSDHLWVEGEGLDFVFGWGATCSINHFVECHGAYSDQTHIEGEEPSKGSDFVGIAEGISSECKVEFEC